MLDRMRPVTRPLLFCLPRRASCRCNDSKTDAIDTPHMPIITQIAALQSCSNSNRKQTTPSLEIVLQVNMNTILTTLKLSCCSVKKGVRHRSFKVAVVPSKTNTRLHTKDYGRKRVIYSAGPVALMASCFLSITARCAKTPSDRLTLPIHDSTSFLIAT